MNIDRKILQRVAVLRLPNTAESAAYELKASEILEKANEKSRVKYATAGSQVHRYLYHRISNKK